MKQYVSLNEGWGGEIKVSDIMFIYIYIYYKHVAKETNIL